MTAEQEVRGAWESVSAGPDIHGYGVTLPTGPPHLFVGYEKSKDAWRDVAAFTRERAEQIRQKCGEISAVENVICDYLDCPGADLEDTEAHAAMRRILSMLEAQLAELSAYLRPEWVEQAKKGGQ
jgi:hypothetical protein